MGYKLICIDLDGTLLTDDNVITETSKNALKKANDLGVHVAISTGRTFVDARHYSELIGIRTPIISSNGAYILDGKSEEIIYRNVLTKNLLKDIFQVLNKYNVTPGLNTPTKKYYGSDYANLLNYLDEKSKRLNVTINVYDREFVEDHLRWAEVIEKEENNIIKCEVYCDVDIVAKIRKELEKHAELEIVASTHGSIELMCKGASKGRGVEMLAAHLGVSLQDVIAIGDSENDRSMVQVAGLGVAMGNALPMVLDVADYVTASNNDEGVTKVVEKFILNL